MTIVTYYMYSCDTCCMNIEMMEMNGRDCAKCQNQDKKDTLGILGIFPRQSEFHVFLGTGCRVS